MGPPSASINPRHLLLAVPQRKTDFVSFAPIGEYIRTSYGERESREAADDLTHIQEVSKVINSLVGP